MRGLALRLALIVLVALPALAQAQFSAQIMPPRFEDSAKPGEVYREVIEISNIAPVPLRMKVSTSDWSLNAEGGVAFQASLADQSCRPWTALEATEIEVPANGKRRFRFEVRVPADAASQQCRFAVMFEGEPTPVPGVALPVAGRIGIIVYLDVGDARAQLSVVGSGVVEEGGRPLPMLRVRNTGNAHGRIEGFIDAIDATGERWTLAPAGNPILPGVTRDIPLYPVVNDDDPIVLAFPMQVKGKLEWRGQSIDIDATADR